MPYSVNGLRTHLRYFFLLKTHTLLQYVQHSGHKESRSASLSFKENLGQNGIKGYIHFCTLQGRCLFSAGKIQAGFSLCKKTSACSIQETACRTTGISFSQQITYVEHTKCKFCTFWFQEIKINFAFSWHFQIYLMIKTNFFLK